jgi:hypothetical protein
MMHPFNARGDIMRHVVGTLVVGITVAVLSAPAFAQKQPTVSDIATCNKEAASAAGTPSASPRLPDAGPGTSGRIPDARGGVLAERGPASRRPAPPGGTVAGPTDSTGQVVTEPANPRLEGMATARAADPAYRTAYGDCMKRLGY